MPKIIFNPSGDVTILKNVMIPMRDDAQIAADVYLPNSPTGSASSAHPTIVDFLPTRKDDVRPGGWGAWNYEFFPRNGYAIVRVDVRGTGASEGRATDEYALEDQLDGYDTIEWIAKQPWCDGNVNIMGISYGGFAALQIAAHNPPHLRSVIPVDFSDDRYRDDCHYRGGLLRQWFDFGFYASFLLAFNVLPPYPEWSEHDWARIWETRLADHEPFVLTWLRHQTDGPYWRHGSVGDVAERIQCPVFMIGGWRDGYPTPPLRLFEQLRVPRKVLIGPWGHQYPDSAIPGPRIDYLPHVLRWLDQWNKGAQADPPNDAPVVAFMQRWQRPRSDVLDVPGEWRAERQWPAEGSREVSLFLADSHSLAAEPQSDETDAFEYVPTVGVTRGLDWFMEFGLPGDQRPDEAFSLVYTSMPLDEELHILGQPRAVLHAASTATVVAFVVTLCDVGPDESSHLVSRGVLNATRRNSFTDPTALVPGEVYELEVPLDTTGWIFDKDHRIRVSVSSADWPNLWPTPESATNEIFRGLARPSRIILPAVPPKGSAFPPEFEPSRTSVTGPGDALEQPTWHVVDDLLTGRRTVKTQIKRAHRLDSRTVIRREYAFEANVDPRDPASASASGKHVTRIERSHYDITARADVTMLATTANFHVLLHVDLEVNGASHFQKRWTESIPRNLL